MKLIVNAIFLASRSLASDSSLVRTSRSSDTSHTHDLSDVHLLPPRHDLDHDRHKRGVIGNLTWLITIEYSMKVFAIVQKFIVKSGRFDLQHPAQMNGIYINTNYPLRTLIIIAITT